MKAAMPQPGTKGIVVGVLRPTGKVMIEGTLYHAMSNGSFMENGEEVVVDYLDESVLVVTPKGER